MIRYISKNLGIDPRDPAYDPDYDAEADYDAYCDACAAKEDERENL